MIPIYHPEYDEPLRVLDAPSTSRRNGGGWNPLMAILVASYIHVCISYRWVG